MGRRTNLSIVLTAIVWWATPLSVTSVAQDTVSERFGYLEARAFLKKHCVYCHGDEDPKAKLDLTDFPADRTTPTDLARLMDLQRRMTSGEMPPVDAIPPDVDDVRRLSDWIDREVAAGAKRHDLDPGHVAVRRLSRFEYENTIRDLLGVDARQVTADFPSDGLAYGFDNVGDAMKFSMLHVEKYQKAAERIASMTIDIEDPSNPPVRGLDIEVMQVTESGVMLSGVAQFFAQGRIWATIAIPRDGDYVLRVRASADQAGREVARMAVFVDKKRIELIDVPATSERPETYDVAMRLEKGDRRVGVAFVNDYYNPEHPDPNERDRNLCVSRVQVVGPVDRRPPTRGHAWIFEVDPGRGRPDRRALPILERLASKAWRRSVRRSEVKKLARLAKNVVEGGGSFEEGIRLALEAVLVSPQFLLRLEPRGRRRKGTRPELDDSHLATRLSYFLWSSLPDDRLSEIAASDRLTRPTVLEMEARRMLRDSRSKALAQSFAGQWLELRKLEDVTPDPSRFNTFDDKLRRSIRTETELFFEAVLRGRRPVIDLLDADFTFLDETLARHYGIEGIEGDEFRRVTLKDPRRGGLLGHASIHTLTSNPTRTSPVKRGKWILENLLDAPPPPPPPGADSLKGEAEIENARTLREQMALHRSDPACATCHVRMDNLGLALENYDAVGKWREADEGGRIDASGRLPDGARLDGPIALRERLRDDRAFVETLTKKLFVYAVGRDTTDDDRVALRAMAIESDWRRVTLEELIVAVVKMDAFRRRGGVDKR